MAQAVHASAWSSTISGISNMLPSSVCGRCRARFIVYWKFFRKSGVGHQVFDWTKRCCDKPARRWRNEPCNVGMHCVSKTFNTMPNLRSWLLQFHRFFCCTTVVHLYLEATCDQNVGALPSCKRGYQLFVYIQGTTVLGGSSTFFFCSPIRWSASPNGVQPLRFPRLVLLLFLHRLPVCR